MIETQVGLVRYQLSDADQLVTVYVTGQLAAGQRYERYESYSYIFA